VLRINIYGHRLRCLGRKTCNRERSYGYL